MNCPICLHKLDSLEGNPDYVLACNSAAMINGMFHSYYQGNSTFPDIRHSNFYMHVFYIDFTNNGNVVHYSAGSEEDLFFVKLGGTTIDMPPFCPSDCLDIIHKILTLKSFL